MENAIEAEITPAEAKKLFLPPYSKSRVLRFARAAFGNETRFQTMDGGALALIVKRVLSNEFYAAAEVRCKNPKDAHALPWLCFAAAMEADGTEVIPKSMHEVEFRALPPLPRPEVKASAQLGADPVPSEVPADLPSAAPVDPNPTKLDP